MSTSNLAAYSERNARFAATDAQPDVSATRSSRSGRTTSSPASAHARNARPRSASNSAKRSSARYIGGRVTDHQGKDLAQVCDLNKNKTADADRFEVTIIHQTDCGSALSADEELRRSFPAHGGYDEQTHQAPTQTGAITEDPTSATERRTGKNEGRKER